LKQIIYITDHSITHPIFNSQGIPHIIALTSRGYKFSLVSFETKKGSNSNIFNSVRNLLRKNNIEHYFVKIPGKPFAFAKLLYWLLGFLKVSSVCFKDNPTIIHTRSYSPTLIALLIKFIFRVRIVFDMRGIYVEEMVERKTIKRNSMRHYIELFLEKLYVKYSDRLISVSKKHQQYCNNYYKKLDITSKNILIRNTVDINNFKILAKSSNGCYNPRFVYAGHFTTKYDIKGMFELFKAATEIFAEPSLNILTYLKEDPFVELINNSFPNLKDHISINKSEPQDIPVELTKADIGLVLLNRYKSNYVSAPIKLVEYLAAGLIPIVNRFVGDTEAILSKYNVCVFVDNDNHQQTLIKLKKLLDDPETSARCRHIAKKEFNIENAVEEYSKVYSHLAK